MVINFSLPSSSNSFIPFNFDIEIYISVDKGNSFTLFLTETFNITVESTRETLIIDNMGSYDDLIIKLVTIQGMIVLSGQLLIENMGIK